jgi:hypothetical protein
MDRPAGRTLTRTGLNRVLTRIRQHDRHAPHPLAVRTPDELTDATTKPES